MSESELRKLLYHLEKAVTLECAADKPDATYATLKRVGDRVTAARNAIIEAVLRANG